MPRPLRTKDVVERLHVLPLESYALISNVAKGLALSVGSVVLLQILANAPREWPRLLPWSASIVAVFLSYVKWTRGAVLSNGTSNLWDSFIPLLMSIAEFSLFAILVVDNAANPTLWLNWSACVAAHAFLASLLVHNRIKMTNIERDFSEHLRDLGREYVEWLRRDRIQAYLIGVVSLLFWFVGRIWIVVGYGERAWVKWICLFAILLFLGEWKPITDANRERKRSDDFVAKKKSPLVVTKISSEQDPTVISA